MKQWMILVPFALMACGDKAGDTGTETETQADVTPQEGAWTVTSMEITGDTCGITSEDTGGLEDYPSMSLAKNADASYTLTMDDDTVFACAVSGSAFTCEPNVNVEEDTENGMTMTTTMTIGSTLASESVMDGNLGMDLSCEGEGCALVAQFGMTLPCSVSATFSASAGE